MTPSIVTAPAESPAPGAPMREVAQRLTSYGLNVVLPEDKDSRRLAVTGSAGMSCDVHIDDEDYGEFCEYLSLESYHAQPAQVCMTVARMLGLAYADPTRYTDLHRGVTLAGAVGREMQARGLKVVLDVFEDDEEFRVSAEVVISRRANPEYGEVHISDDGGLYWVSYPSDLPGGVAGLADTIAATMAPGHAVASKVIM